MTIEVNNRQKRYRTNSRRLKRLAEHFLQYAQRLAPDEGWEHLCILLLDDELISSVNADHFNRRAGTDVISVRYSAMPGEEDVNAEIFLNVQRAHEESKRRQWDLNHELALYLAHGIDHLCGADDTAPADAARMRRRELRWLRKAVELELVDRLVENPEPSSGGRERV